MNNTKGTNQKGFNHTILKLLSVKGCFENNAKNNNNDPTEPAIKNRKPSNRYNFFFFIYANMVIVNTIANNNQETLNGEMVCESVDIDSFSFACII